MTTRVMYMYNNVQQIQSKAIFHYADKGKNLTIKKPSNATTLSIVMCVDTYNAAILPLLYIYKKDVISVSTQ